MVQSRSQLLDEMGTGIQFCKVFFVPLWYHWYVTTNFSLLASSSLISLWAIEFDCFVFCGQWLPRWSLCTNMRMRYQFIWSTVAEVAFGKSWAKIAQACATWRRVSAHVFNCKFVSRRRNFCQRITEKMYTILQNKRMRRCGVPPPPIIFERLKLPQQIICRRNENLSESPNHQKYWENILVSRFYEQFSRNRRTLGHFRKFEKISNS